MPRSTAGWPSTPSTPSTRPPDRPAASQLPPAPEPLDDIGRHRAILPPSWHPAAGGSGIEAFLATVRPKLESLLAARKVPVEDAEDLVQDALLSLLEHGLGGGIDNHEGWLLGTLRNKILEYRRRQARQLRLLELLSRAVAVSQPALQERQHALHDLLALTAHLPPRAVMVLWLRIGLGHKPREVALILRCRPGSVRKLTRRALKRVQRELAGAAPPRVAVDPTHPIAPVPIVRPVWARRGQARRGSAPDRSGATATPSPGRRLRR